MFCMSCGAQNNDTAQFCAKCGKPLTNSAQATPAAVQEAAPVATQQVAQNYSQPAAQPQYGQAPAQQAYGQPAYMTPAPAVEGAIGAGWRDITTTPGWFKKVLLLCLINIVPLLGYCTTTGYCLRWARELSFNKREPMPQKIFRKHEIVTGFKAFLVAFMIYAIWGILVIAAIAFLAGIFAMMNVVAGIIMLLILGFVAAVFTAVWVAPAVQACQMRMAITGVLEKGFNVKDVWACFRRGMGSLIGASLVPNIVVAIIRTIITSIINWITSALIFGSAYNMMSSAFSGSSRSSASALNSLMGSPFGMFATGDIQGIISLVSGALLMMIFVWLLVYVIESLFNLFASLWSFRAVGHWAARFAPEWSTESDEGTLDALREDSLAVQEAYVGAGVADYSKPLQ